MADAPSGDPGRAPDARFRHLPPAIPVATTVAVVGAVPTVPLGPDSGGDGD